MFVLNPILVIAALALLSAIVGLAVWLARKGQRGWAAAVIAVPVLLVVAVVVLSFLRQIPSLFM